MGKLDNKVALVTGSASGIGFEIARTMLQEGAKVCLNDVNEQNLKSAVDELRNEFGEGSVNYAVGSVADKTQAVNIVNQTVEIFGTISILVNNAGGGLNTPLKTFEDFAEEDWDLLLDVNLKGTFLVSQAAVKIMKQNHYGRIINIASMSGRTGNKLSSVAYSAAKGGVISFTKGLACEVGKSGINVNTIAPGLIISGERIRNLVYSNPEAEKNLKAELAVEDFGEPKDIANASVFLASEDAKYVTGVTLDVNGGGYMA